MPVQFVRERRAQVPHPVYLVPHDGLAEAGLRGSGGRLGQCQRLQRPGRAGSRSAWARRCGGRRSARHRQGRPAFRRVGCRGAGSQTAGRATGISPGRRPIPSLPRSGSSSAATPSPATASQGPRDRFRLPPGADAARVERIADGVFLTRDLINTPTNDMGPAAIEAAVRQLAAAHGGVVSAVVGDELLAANFPMIHAVGRAAAEAPRLIDLAWGPADGAQGHAGRQGRVLRHRRPRHQAVERHAPDEEGHGRRSQCAGPGLDDHGRPAASSPASARSRGGECRSRATPSGRATC